MVSLVQRIFLAICIIAMLTACAKKSIIVLLPDQDGKTGVVEVSNRGGSQKLNAPNEATEIRSASTAPGPPEIMRDDQVKKVFGEAIEAKPPRPLHYTLYFLSDSTRFTDDSARLFEQVVASIEKIKPAEISVVGHTDRMGTREQNFRLGFGRASQVKSLLVKRGISAGLVEIASHGEDNPLVKTDDNVPEPKNRRVEIVVR